MKCLILAVTGFITQGDSILEKCGFITHVLTVQNFLTEVIPQLNFKTTRGIISALFSPKISFKTSRFPEVSPRLP
jgi:hypothetical protein